MQKLLNKWRAYIRENENDQEKIDVATDQLEDVLTEQKVQVLRRGMRDKDPNGPIHKLQNMLKNLKPPLYAEQPDGVYGGKTQEAVKDFQRTQVKAKKMPPRNERGRSNIDGIAGPMTMALLQQASGSSEEQPKSAPKAKEPQNRKVALTNGIAARLQSDLSGYVDEGEMKNVVTLLKFADKNGILAAVSQKYMSITGDGLQATIRGVMGVHKLKNQALAILAGKAAKKDITTQLDDATTMSQDVKDHIRDAYGAIPFSVWDAIETVPRFLKFIKYGPPHYRAAFKFAAGSTTPFTEKDLEQSEIDQISKFMDNMTNPQNPEYRRIMRKAGRYGRFFKAQAENVRKPNGSYSFGNRAFGCRGKECNNELYAAFRKINPLKGGEVKVNPKTTVGMLKLLMGQFRVINKGNYWLIEDFFDFNDWTELADNNAGFQEYYKKIYEALEGSKDQIVGKQTKLGAKCAHRKGKGRLYNFARCFLPIRHALRPSDKYPWETEAYSTYKGFPIRLKIPKKPGAKLTYLK
jgi:hypothetical protein